MEPNVWYTMKFQTSTENGKAILKGKVWKKGEAEPAEWTISGEDVMANTNGSPGLFADAKNAEVFYDNLSVYPNTEAVAAPAAAPAK
jgi:hypothetical protein